MRYNTDMNDVIFVEEAVSHYATEAGRYLEIIVPVSADGKESGPAGKIKYGNTEARTLHKRQKRAAAFNR